MLRLCAVRAPVLVALAIALAACSSGLSTKPAALYDPRALPTGPLGQSIAYGRAIITDTPRTMKGYTVADMSCAACHVNGGTVARGLSFVGTYARFPRWNKRAHRVIALQDRLAECFLYSMNGKPPAFSSRAMIAMAAYIAWLSRGVPVGAHKPYVMTIALPARSPDPKHGARIYAQRCEACHQAGGAGISGTFPPLWGATSFNRGAGMAHLARMTTFVKDNMPQTAPGSLSVDEAYDVSAFVLSHKRPAFRGRAVVHASALPANFF